MRRSIVLRDDSGSAAAEFVMVGALLVWFGSLGLAMLGTIGLLLGVMGLIRFRQTTAGAGNDRETSAVNA